MDEVDFRFYRFYKPGLTMVKSTAELTHEFFDMWSKTYEATYGRLIEVPAMGPARERSEKVMKNFSITVNLYTAWMESIVNFQNVFIEAMRRTREKMVAGMEEEANTEIYKDFYRVWIETYSETFKEFLKSGHFSSDMGMLTSYFVDFQRSNRELLEENVLRPMNLPTRTEIDEVNKELYHLKKTEKGLIKELSEERARLDEIYEMLDPLKMAGEDTISQIKELSEETTSTKAEIDGINRELDSLKKTVQGLTGQIKGTSEKK